MRKKFVYIAFLLGIALTSWIYWQSNAEFKDTVAVIKRKIYKLNDVTLKPAITFCESNL